MICVLSQRILAAGRDTNAGAATALSDEESIVCDVKPENAPVLDAAREVHRAGKIPFAQFKKEFFKTDTPVVSVENLFLLLAASSKPCWFVSLMCGVRCEDWTTVSCRCRRNYRG